MKRSYIILFNILFTAFSITGNSQTISMDRGILAAGLWCFPLVTDSLSWVYLPDKGVLGVDENKKPQFSFIRYVNISDKSTDDPNSITRADGGAVLHFLVTYDTDEKKIQSAADKLREIFNNPGIKIKGPVIFKEGRYALVSSILDTATQQTERKLMSMGSAPLLQGNKIALSFEMDPQHATLLMESLKMATPDLSIIFEMTFSGLTDAYKATIDVNWSEVHKSEAISGGFKIYFIGPDIEKVYDDLRRTQAIKIYTEGANEDMEKLVEASYTKVMEMMFQKVEPDKLPPEEKNALTGLLEQLFSSKAKDKMANSKMAGFGAYFGYKKKNIKTSGTSTLSFNSRTPVDRRYYITFNMSDFYKKYGNDENYIRAIPLNGIEFTKRTIAVGVDGNLLPEFDKLVNNVTVTLRKHHQDSINTTLKEVRIVKSSLDKGAEISMSYGSFGDVDRDEWLNYEYNAQFSFLGGLTWETGWKKQNSAMINLFTPYERRVIKLEGNADSLRLRNVRATTIRVEYQFLDGVKSYETTVRPGDDLSAKQFDITLPAGVYSYKYTLRWQLKNGSEKKVSGETDSGILFIDSVPD